MKPNVLYCFDTSLIILLFGNIYSNIIWERFILTIFMVPLFIFTPIKEIFSKIFSSLMKKTLICLLYIYIYIKNNYLNKKLNNIIKKFLYFFFINFLFENRKVCLKLFF